MGKKFFIVWMILLPTVLLPAKSWFSKDNNLKEAVVLIHGILARPVVMWKMEQRLKKTGYLVLNFDYYSTRWSMDSIVTKLHNEVRELEPKAHKIHFVTHSLGGFVIRAYLAKHPCIKFDRLVMVAPPNKGSALADRYEDKRVFEWVYGKTGQNLGTDEDDYLKQYPPPSISFGIIAGGKGDEGGFSKVIPGDDDGVVGVEETKLVGCSDFVVIQGLHSTLLWQDKIVDSAMHFIKKGRFPK